MCVSQGTLGEGECGCGATLNSLKCVVYENCFAKNELCGKKKAAGRTGVRGREKGDHGWKHLEKEKAGTGRGMKMHKGLIDFSLQRETALSIMFFLN